MQQPDFKEGQPKIKEAFDEAGKDELEEEETNEQDQKQISHYLVL